MTTWNPRERRRCKGCGALEGELHDRGCDLERCPFCLGHLISCGCACRHFYPGYDFRLPTCGLPQDVYEHGLPDHQAKKWERLLARKGRIPHLVLPNICARCGEVWPEMFLAEDWQQVMPRTVHDEILCRACYEAIKGFMLAGKRPVRTRRKRT